MRNLVGPGAMVANRNVQSPSRFDAANDSVKNSLPTRGNTSAKRLSVRPTPPQDLDTPLNGKSIQWGTHKQTNKPDGKFGPARQLWGDCWFMAALAALSNDKDGQQILAKSIQRVRVADVDGYFVTFAGAPKDKNKVFISDKTLTQYLKTKDGDADTRLIELSADRFFSVRGNYKSIFIASKIKSGMSQQAAEQRFAQLCSKNNIQDPLAYNPMRKGAQNETATFLFTSIYPETLWNLDPTPLQRSRIMAYLNRYVANNRDGASVVISVIENPLGDSHFARDLVIYWDVIRTDIRANGRVDQPERDFLNALVNYLDSPDDASRQALWAAAYDLDLPHIFPVSFVSLLVQNQDYYWRQHRNVLRSGAEEVLGGGPGYIGFTGGHVGTIEGINEAANTFTYSEPYFPTMVHTGELSHLIQAIQDGNAKLNAIEPKNDDDHDDRELLERSSWDPPLNHIYSRRSPLQKLRLALATLNEWPVKRLADYLEYLDDKGVAGNDRYGRYGVWKLSQLPLDSPLWNEIVEPFDKWYANGMKRKWLGIRPEYRQMIKDMAARIVNPTYKSLMDRVIGSHGIFDPGELEAWLSNHRRNGEAPDSIAFDKFYTSVKELNEKAVTMMEYLEWEDDPQSDRDNHRFGMRGVQLLSRLTPKSEQWDASGSGHVDHVTRQRLIDEAKLLMRRDYALWTFQLHHGDMIFEPDDMQHWLAHNRM